MGNAASQEQPPPKVVLVPPLFERDIRQRSRMAYSSYDFLFAKPALNWLFTDYIQNGAKAWMHFRPAEDPRVSVSATLGTSTDKFGADTAGDVTLRFQPDPEDPLTFFDINAAAARGGRARARACVFHPESGLGFFASVPLTRQGSAHTATVGDVVAVGPKLPSGAAAERGEVGVRYSSPTFTAGAILAPSPTVLKQVWLCGHQGNFTYGIQASPDAPLRGVYDASDRVLSQLLQETRDRLSYAVAYSPSGQSPYGRGSFTACAEVVEQRQLQVSFLYHLATQRRVQNPFEDEDVVAITNYIDIGLQVATDVSEATEEVGVSGRSGSAALAVAVQANKNLLLKAKLGTSGVSAAVAFKAWWQPSFVVAASASYSFRAYALRFGLSFGVENFGNIRYERSKTSQRTGRSLVQRHVALPMDIANKEGQGLLVRKDDLDNPEILGQVEHPSANYL